MPAACKVCSHPRLQEVEATLVGGAAELDVAEKYSLTRAALRKHLTTCAPRAGAKVAKARARRSSSSEEAQPASSRRPSQKPASVSPPRAIGGHVEELRRSLEKLVRASEAPDVSPAHLASLGGRILSVSRELRRVESERGIQEHPAFVGLVEDLVAAWMGELGPDAPEGLEARVADRFERLQAERVYADEPESRSAA